MVFDKIDFKNRINKNENVFYFTTRNNKITLTPDETKLIEAGTKITANILQRYEDYLDIIFGKEIDETKTYTFECRYGVYDWYEVE